MKTRAAPPTELPAAQVCSASFKRRSPGMHADEPAHQGGRC